MSKSRPDLIDTKISEEVDLNDEESSIEEVPSAMSRSMEQSVEVMALEDDDEDDGGVQRSSSAGTEGLEEEEKDSNVFSDVRVNSSSRRMSGLESEGGSDSDKSLWETEEEDGDLIDAFFNCDLDTARKLLGKSNARYLVEQTNPYSKDNALHWACCCGDTPLDIIQATINTSETAPLQRNADGQTPLHCAIAFSSEEIIIMLLEACPRAASIADNQGWTPLHYAINNNKSSNVIRRLLVANPTAAMNTNIDRETPLHLFFKYWNVPLRNTLESINSDDQTIQDIILRYGRTEIQIGELHQTALLLLQAGTHGRIEENHESQYQPLRTAIIDPHCPWSFAQLSLRMDLKEASQCDFEGLLPIHVAAAATSSGDGDLYKCGYCECRIQDGSWFQEKDAGYSYCLSCSQGFDEEEKKVFTFMSSVNKVPAVIRDLLVMNPMFAEIPNGEGRLPLHIAIESEKSFDKGLEAILRAAPKGLNTRDIRTHMYPFQHAAVTHDRGGNTVQKYTNCFTLLMDDPHLVFYGIPH